MPELNKPRSVGARLLTLILLALALLGGCGQKGPLKLPPKAVSAA
jgi:predicted small lipoprotein YifL